MKYHYGICTGPDEDIFQKQCKALEKNVPAIVKDKLLEDVDGSLIQLYFLDGKQNTVHNSYYVGSVYVDSEIELTQFFKH